MTLMADDCDEYMMCGLPVFNHRWYKARHKGVWLPRKEPVIIPKMPQLTLISKAMNSSTNSMRYRFRLSGPPHMSIFIQPLNNVFVSDWSFITNMLDDPKEYQPPYHIFFSYGADSSPLDFYLDLKKTDGVYDDPLFELGIAAHYVSFEHDRDATSVAFIESFPEYMFVMEWPSSYERYIF